MTGVEWGGEAREPTAAERDFAEDLSERLAGLDFWLHADADGEPWLLVSMDLTRHGAVVAVPRIDFDAQGARGGYSPACLNWDAGARADSAGIDTSKPPGCHFDPGPDLAQQVAIWFSERRAETL
jgi:hypothetical protein